MIASGLCPSTLLLATLGLLLLHGTTAGWVGDILGRRTHSAQAQDTGPTLLGAEGRPKATDDHARFYSAADALTRWAESTFALSAEAHKQLLQQPDGARSACVYDGKECLFNPYTVDSPAFPQPEHIAEARLKTFTEQAATCRNATEPADCHLDPLCDWDGRNSTCFLARDLHADFMNSIAPCEDLLYTPLSETCWRRTPDPHSSLPCGDTACKFYPQGSGTTHGGVGAGTPAERCMLGAEVRHLGPADVYELLRLRYGEEQGTNLTGGTGEMRALGFGSCPTAALHHALVNECHTGERAVCAANARCAVVGIVAQEFCVLSLRTTVDLLLGGSAFTQAVLQTESACVAASASRDSCLAVGLADQARAARAAAARRARRRA